MSEIDHLRQVFTAPDPADMRDGIIDRKHLSSRLAMAIIELDERLKRVEAACGIDRPTEVFQQSRPHSFRQSWGGDPYGCSVCGLSFSHPVHDPLKVGQ